ncbi:hypothetical protein M9H77_20084 [Catharanthus roseus]|uniref:Uncharacterized protein n=1 Tax=Catharanthus roseus TaxID=4058 RepID=A0ACC0AJ56_CATRO|nr:hypothetical protein M9H77_20084 [Catharanthus roseus]
MGFGFLVKSKFNEEWDLVSDSNSACEIQIQSGMGFGGRSIKGTPPHAILTKNTTQNQKDAMGMERRRRRRNVNDEDIALYLANKVAKKLKSDTISGYTNESNPFGDSNLVERFIWRKKIQRDVAVEGLSLKRFTPKAEKKRQKQILAEIEKGKRRRELRAMEKARHEEEMAILSRERDRAEFQDWEKKEEEFLFHQGKIRSQIRLNEGRMKPIDILMNQLNCSDREIEEPYLVFKNLGIEELEQLKEDIKLNMGFDRETPVRMQYWEALMVICDDELAKARKRDAFDGLFLAQRSGINSSIEADVMNFLKGKSYSELEDLQSRIESEMQSGEAKVVEFWETLVNRIPVLKAKALLQEIHSQILQKEKGKPHLKNSIPDHHQVLVSQESALEEEEEEDGDQEEEGSYSPAAVHGGDDYESGIDPQEDKEILEKKRLAVKKQRQLQLQLQEEASEEDSFEHKALKAMGAMEEGDSIFGYKDEINLDSQVCSRWQHHHHHHKFRPRKPKYFNRVHTGYIWNKYNQNHYNHENPPPKTIEGYKFNIFYPDLLDKSKAPSYSIEKDGEEEKTCILRFHGGPPYEDIAFRIVNNEWEYSKKKGFKCIFERGILHLYFNFKRFRYRR